MFAKIRNRLTVQYVTVMAVFLLTFIVVSYSGVLWLLHREEQQDIKAFTEEEAREHVMLLKNREYRMEIKQEDNSPGSKLFSYVYNDSGQLVAAEFPAFEARSGIESLIAKWEIPDGEGRIKQFRLANGEKAVFILCSTHIYDGQEILGKVYVGEDITSYFEMLKMMLIGLVVVAIIFLFGAAYLGHLLAGRAIVPIKQSFSRQREFAADASHELRTPLSILLTSVEAVQTDDGNGLTAFSAQTLDDMKSEIRRMSKIVTDLLTLARADTEFTNIIKEKFDLYAVTEQVLRSFQPLADEKGIAIELDSVKDIAVFADRERMNQLLVILLDNAIKYTPAGGSVKVSVQLIPGKKTGFSINVTDTGIGIPEEDKELIFERFYRIDKVRARAEGGTGLGLSIAKWITEAHGGTICAESVAGNGSSFTVTIPG